MRAWFAWLIAVPLAVIGTLAGHAAGYRAAVPNAHERAHLLASTGHGYLQYAPLFVSLSRDRLPRLNPILIAPVAALALAGAIFWRTRRRLEQSTA
jgi:hypothetical protein